MAEVFLPIVLVATLIKTVLVVDAVCFSGGGSGVVARTAQTIRSQTSQAPTTSQVASPRHQSKGAASSGASKTKSVHRWLFGMHVTTAINQGAVVAKYFVPVSDISCVVTQRTMVVFSVLFDATMVMFLLAKAHVVNANRILAWWERGIIWWSRMFACVYLALTALFLGVMFPVSANPEGRCKNGLSGALLTINALLSTIQQILLIIQFVLLLGIFIRPLLGRVEGMQSGGSLYRRVVLKNAICTAGIVIVYAIKTIILRKSAKSNQIGRDLTRAVSGLAVLILTEMVLPIGYTSLVKACLAENSQGGSTTTVAMGKTTKTEMVVAGTLTNSKAKAVVPIEEPPPQMP